jgi:hypothetical protein
MFEPNPPPLCLLPRTPEQEAEFGQWYRELLIEVAATPEPPLTPKAKQMLRDDPERWGQLHWLREWDK